MAHTPNECTKQTFKDTFSITIGEVIVRNYVAVSINNWLQDVSAM